MPPEPPKAKPPDSAIPAFAPLPLVEVPLLKSPMPPKPPSAAPPAPMPPLPPLPLFEFPAFSSIKSLKRREKALKDNCAMLEKQMSGDRQVIPLLQRIRSMGIGLDKLSTFSIAVNEKAQKYNLSISAAAYRLIEDMCV
jgi:hypothetical protein